jgi:ubiquinone/menaquinone biosynthesis C-methylase UbiE
MFMKKKISNPEFKVMQGLMKLVDVAHPYVPERAKIFGIRPGMTVVDYGCGPGRYAVEFARLVGEGGKVYAVDLIEIALREAEKRLKKNNTANVELVLAEGYASGIPAGVADMVCAIDMFHHVDPVPFLQETERIAKPDGVLILSGGHMTRSRVKKEVAASGLWLIAEESHHFIKYKKGNT